MAKPQSPRGHHYCPGPRGEPEPVWLVRSMLSTLDTCGTWVLTGETAQVMCLLPRWRHFLRATPSPLQGLETVRYGRSRGRWRQTGSCGSRKLWMKTLVVPVMRYMIWSQILNSLSLGFLICKMDWCLTEFSWELKETVNIKTSSVSWRMVGIQEVAVPGSRAQDIRVTRLSRCTMLL